MLEFPVELTPTTRRPSRSSRDRVIDDLGLAPARGRLLKEAVRLERLADKNARESKGNGADSKRARAARLRRAAGLLAEVEHQIDRWG